MKNCRKLVILALALILNISMSSCGGQSAVTASAPSPTAEASSKPTAEPEPTPETGLMLGQIMGAVDGMTYTNEFAGLGCTLDEDWTYMSTREVLQLMGAVSDMVQDEELSAVLERSGNVYTMYATAGDGIKTMNMAFQKLNVFEEILTESDCIEAAIKDTASLFEATGMVIEICEHTTVMLAGEERECMHIEGSYSGVPFYEDVIVIKYGEYMAALTFACYIDNTLPAMEGTFYTVK